LSRPVSHRAPAKNPNANIAAPATITPSTRVVSKPVTGQGYALPGGLQRARRLILQRPKGSAADRPKVIDTADDEPTSSGPVPSRRPADGQPAGSVLVVGRETPKPCP